MLKYMIQITHGPRIIDGLAWYAREIVVADRFDSKTEEYIFMKDVKGVPTLMRYHKSRLNLMYEFVDDGSANDAG